MAIRLPWSAPTSAVCSRCGKFCDGVLPDGADRLGADERDRLAVSDCCRAPYRLVATEKPPASR